MAELLEGARKDALTVTELNTLVHDIFEATDIFSGIAVRGEISNLVKHRSGHYYFSLKDSESLLRALMFRADTARLPFDLQNGMNIVAYGTLGTYIKDGSYRLVAYRIEPDGVGTLHMAFEALKRRLAEEGLFDPARKKPIPKIPSAVGIITSPTGAAVRDLIHVLGRRFPFVKVVLYPALVQGEGAHKTLVAGIETFCHLKNVDLIIIGRGGGSAEDLWEFNSEALARAIAAADIPVISAVGHETDFTICDFVADLRAPTPSAAAELAVPETEALKRRFYNVIDRMYDLCRGKMNVGRETLDRMKARRLFTDPAALYSGARNTLSFRSEALTRSMNMRLALERTRFEKFTASLDALSPLRVLTRGYAVAMKDGKSLRSEAELAQGAEFDVRLSDGSLRAKRIDGKETKDD